MSRLVSDIEAKYYPLQLLTYRARYEQTVRGHLPKQYIALARLQLAALWHQPKMARRALPMARYFGVPWDQVIHALGHAMLYKLRHRYRLNARGSGRYARRLAGLWIQGGEAIAQPRPGRIVSTSRFPRGRDSI